MKQFLLLLLTANICFSEITIRSQPQSENICYESDFELSVRASSEEPLNYQWKKDGRELVAGIDSPFQTDESKLIFYSADYSMSGNYTCEIWEDGNRENSIETDVAVVYVLQEPELLSAPEYVYTNYGEPFEIKVETNIDDPDVEFQWYKIDYSKSPIDTLLLTDNEIYAGTNSSILSIFDTLKNYRSNYFFAKIITKCGEINTEYLALNYPSFIFRKNYDFRIPLLRTSDWGIESDYYDYYFNYKNDTFLNLPNYKLKLIDSSNTQYIDTTIYSYDNRIRKSILYLKYKYTCKSAPFFHLYAIINDKKIDSIKLQVYDNFPTQLKPIPDFQLDENETLIFEALTLDTNSILKLVRDDYVIEKIDGTINIKLSKVIRNLDPNSEKNYVILNIDSLKEEDSGDYRIKITSSGCWGTTRKYRNSIYTNTFHIDVIPKESAPLSVEDDRFDLIISPNPFSSVSSIEFNLDKPSFVQITLFDATGREITQLENKYLSSGKHQKTINADEFNLSSGLYFYRIQIGEEIITKEIILE
jgi:hypothetical protein